MALVAALFWASAVLFVANVRYGGDVRALLCLGEGVYLPAPFATVPRAGPSGYDGQQYAVLATDPKNPNCMKINTTENVTPATAASVRIL